MNKLELEERLINFAVMIIEITDNVEKLKDCQTFIGAISALGDVASFKLWGSTKRRIAKKFYSQDKSGI